MPTYIFECTKCQWQIDAYVLMDDRDKPLIAPCGHCGNKKLQRVFTMPDPKAMRTKWDGAADVNKQVTDMTREVTRRQDSAGYGPTVDAQRKATKRVRSDGSGRKRKVEKAKDITKGK